MVADDVLVQRDLLLVEVAEIRVQAQRDGLLFYLVIQVCAHHPARAQRVHLAQNWTRGGEKMGVDGEERWLCGELCTR